MKSTILMAIIFALGPASFACGQFVLDSLPKPGQWAKYDLTSMTTALPGKESDLSIVIRCLPDEGKSDPACVWIELETEFHHDTTVICKLLIPESEFREGGDPIAHLVMGWKLLIPGTETNSRNREHWADGKPKPVSDHRIKSLRESIIICPPDDAEQLMSDNFEANGQSFRCKGLLFSSRFPETDKVEYVMRMETRVSPDTPFGLVVAEVSNTLFNEGKEIETNTGKYVLVASGDNAVSAIPDVK